MDGAREIIHSCPPLTMNIIISIYKLPLNKQKEKINSFAYTETFNTYKKYKQKYTNMFQQINWAPIVQAAVVLILLYGCTT